MLVSCAVVHGTPPQVFLADDLDTLNWVLALQLVAQSRAEDFAEAVRHDLREALLDERWGDAVAGWITATGQAVDVFASYDVHEHDRLPPELAAVELQFTPLFRAEG